MGPNFYGVGNTELKTQVISLIAITNDSVSSFDIISAVHLYDFSISHVWYLLLSNVTHPHSPPPLPPQMAYVRFAISSGQIYVQYKINLAFFPRHKRI